MSPAEALAAAMIDVAARHGYAGASVARVLERSGVSRQAFYRHYSSREDCFLAAYRCAAAEIGERLREAVRQSAPAERPEATIAALLRAVDERPAAARLLLVDALGACAAVRGEHERQLSGIERSIERFLRVPQAPALRIPPVALLGGICGVLSGRVLSAEAGGEEDLFAGLVAWVRSYESGEIGAPAWPGEDRSGPPAAPGHGGRPAGATEVRLLPRGRNALPPAAASGARHSRILAATIRQAAARGYGSLTVTDIVADARVPRSSFYAHFSGKEEAFLAAQRIALRESIAVAAADYVTGSTWPERVWSGLAALLEYVATHPAHAYLGFVEVHAAGGAAIAQHEEMRGAYTLFLAEGYRQHPRADELPPLCSQAVAGAIEAIVRRYVVAGQVDRVREALPQCAYVALAPFIGSEAALSRVKESARAAG
ncbi:MAG TPA: TetR/AcrR family transcriptional regulator [Solirubrobacterales bacterium]